jgi:hypothetical protein
MSASRVPHILKRHLRLAHAGGITVQTLAAHRVVSYRDAQFLALDPDGAHRDVTLPSPVGAEGAMFHIANKAGSAHNLVIKVGLSTLATVAQDRAAIVVSDGTNWIVWAILVTA